MLLGYWVVSTGSSYPIIAPLLEFNSHTDILKFVYSINYTILYNVTQESFIHYQFNNGLRYLVYQYGENYLRLLKGLIPSYNPAVLTKSTM